MKSWLPVLLAVVFFGCGKSNPPPAPKQAPSNQTLTSQAPNDQTPGGPIPGPGATVSGEDTRGRKTAREESIQSEKAVEATKDDAETTERRATLKPPNPNNLASGIEKKAPPILPGRNEKEHNGNDSVSDGAESLLTGKPSPDAAENTKRIVEAIRIAMKDRLDEATTATAKLMVKEAAEKVVHEFSGTPVVLRFRVQDVKPSPRDEGHYIIALGRPQVFPHTKIPGLEDRPLGLEEECFTLYRFTLKLSQKDLRAITPSCGLVVSGQAKLVYQEENAANHSQLGSRRIEPISWPEELNALRPRESKEVAVAVFGSRTDLREWERKYLNVSASCSALFFCIENMTYRFEQEPAN